MTSPAQLKANRANARRSTGPRTAEGKARSRMNALRHGLYADSDILPGEDASRFDALLDGLVAEFRPRDRDATRLVGHMAAIWWRLERLKGVEAAFLGVECEDASGAGGPRANALRAMDADLVRLDRLGCVETRLARVLDQIAARLERPHAATRRRRAPGARPGRAKAEAP